MTETDPLLRRIERGSLVACGVMAAVAWGVARGGVAAPLGVLAGGALVWISYRGIKGGIDAVVILRQAQHDPEQSRGVERAGGGGRGIKTAIGLVKFFTRYAILAVAAYVIMARFGLPPPAVVAGASSVVVAAMVEALRGFQWKS